MLVPGQATPTRPPRRAIARRAVAVAFRKLDPRVQVRNPVMFVVLVGSVLVTLRFAVNLAAGGGPGGRSFTGQVALWLWLTVLFANFAEAMAEARGRADAGELRQARRDATRRQKTPNEIALSVLLGLLTVVFLVAVAAVQPFAAHSGRLAEVVVVLIALLVCLVPTTTIGALLSPIGIAGMDRMVRHNALAASGRAVEAAGGVDTLLLGAAHLEDAAGDGIGERLDRLRRMGIRTVLITGDDPLTAAAVGSEAGVDDFLAKATPERRLELIRAEQAGGRRVAVTGSGAGAVALVQAVELGKQLLVTRGSLTAFSIASGVAECLAVLPALSGAAYPALAGLDVLRLASPRSAVLSAVIFNALAILALLPLALRGSGSGRRRPPPSSAATCSSTGSPASSCRSPPSS